MVEPVAVGPPAQVVPHQIVTRIVQLPKGVKLRQSANAFPFEFRVLLDPSGRWSRLTPVGADSLCSYPNIVRRVYERLR